MTGAPTYMGSSRGSAPETRARAVLTLLQRERGSTLRVTFGPATVGHPDGEVLRAERYARVDGPERGRMVGSCAADVVRVLLDGNALEEVRSTPTPTGRVTIYRARAGAVVKDERAHPGEHGPAAARRGARLDRLDVDDDEEPAVEDLDFEEVAEDDEEPEEPTAPPSEEPIPTPPTEDPMPTATVSQAVTLPPLGSLIPRKLLAALLGLTVPAIRKWEKLDKIHVAAAEPGTDLLGPVMVCVDELLVETLEAKSYEVSHAEPAEPAEPVEETGAPQLPTGAPQSDPSGDGAADAAALDELPDLDGLDIPLPLAPPDEPADKADDDPADAGDELRALVRFDLGPALDLLRHAALLYVSARLQPGWEAEAARQRAAVHTICSAVDDATAEARRLLEGALAIVDAGDTQL